MDKSELIELFYNRAYEKFVNKKILDDKNYIVPRQQLTDYVNELINIPFIQFIDYIKEKDSNKNIEVTDVTQFSTFSACEIEMCDALIWANNPGCQYLDIGRLFPNKIYSKQFTAYKRYGEINIKSSAQLGLSFEYYGYWYLSCLGYIYPDLEKEVRSKLLARTITRNKLYQRLLIDILDHDVKPEEYMDVLSEHIIKRRLRCVCTFLDICLDECRIQKINTFNLIRSYDVYEKPDIYNLPIGTNNRLYHYLEKFDYRKLSRETTVSLIKKYREGDQTATDILVKGYMKLVISIAQTYAYKGLELDDLLQEGIIGLIRSFDHYNVEFNGGFSKYAQWWIRQSMTEAVCTQPLIVQVPTNVISIHRKVWKDINIFEQEYGYPPSVDDFKIDDDTDYKIVKYVSGLPEQLDALTIMADNWDDIIGDHPLPDDSLMKESLFLNVNYLTNKLSDRDSQILLSAYGIGQKEKTYNDIGKEWDLTRERIRQIIEKSIRKLRKTTSFTQFDDIDVLIVKKEKHESSDKGNNNKPTLNNVDKQQSEKDNTSTVKPYTHQAKDVFVQNNNDTISKTTTPDVVQTNEHKHIISTTDNKTNESKSATISTDIINKVFINTVSTYKYYWFISILQLLHNTNEIKLYVYDIISRMIANAWCPIACNGLSFGSGDSLNTIVNQIQKITKLPNDANIETVYKVLQNRIEDPLIKRQLQIIKRNVPIRFLTPWMKTTQSGSTIEQDCLYSLSIEGGHPYITINTIWRDYIELHFEDLMDFSYRALSVFLRKRNPNIYNILKKLKVAAKPINKNSLPQYTVINNGGQCSIIDQNGVTLYSSSGRVKQVGSLFYRFYYAYSTININQINFDKDHLFTTGKRIISAKHNTPLYIILNEQCNSDAIEDIISDGKKRIKINNVWFDENGYILSSKFKPINSYTANPKIGNDTRKEVNIKQPNHVSKKEAMVGDRIIYNSKRCTVIDKHETNGSVRLIVRYENGITDNLKNDRNKYQVL